MRFTKIKSVGGVVTLKYQTPTQAGDGWVSHEHEGKFEPGPEFTAALAALVPICVRTHEVIATAGEFTPEGGATFAIEAHPVEARGINFYRKEKSHLVEVMISGYRHLATSGGFALPGVKRILHPGDDDEHGDLFLTPGETEVITHLCDVARAIIPGLVASIERGKHTNQMTLDLGGDGQASEAQAADVALFDEQARQDAELSLASLSAVQRRVFERLARMERGGEQADEKIKPTIKQLIEMGLAHVLGVTTLKDNTAHKVSLTEAGWNVAELMLAEEVKA